MTSTGTCGIPDRSAAIMAPKSISSHTTTSGRHRAISSSSATARTGAVLRANPSRTSRSSRSRSSGNNGRRSVDAPRSGPLGNAVNPAASIIGTIDGAPVHATS
jgi:hypothetical protein